jgi:NADPH2:quinone reductase
MLAWTLTRHGDPQKVFRLQEHSDPVPGNGQVLIDCEGFGLNYADVMAVRGLYREAPPVPSILGYEVVGRIEKLGDGVPQDLLGRRVVAFTEFGGYAQKVVTDHRMVAMVPDTATLGEAASLATQGCTAWYSSMVLCPLHPLERVLVHSAAGGVGHLLVQLALNRGCEVYAIASGEKKFDFIRTMGVKHVLDRRKDPYGKLKQLLGDRKIDVSFNAVGGSTFKQDMSVLGSGGRIVLFGGAERGGLGSFGTLKFVWRMGLLLPIFLMMKSQSLLGVNMLRMSRNKPEVLSACMKQVVEAYAGGIIRPYVHHEYTHTELPKAHADLAAGGTMGKLVVRWK